MNKLLFAFVVIVAFVAGVLGAVVSNSITGNVIKVKQDKGGKFNVYTKAEVDSLMKNLSNKATYSGVAGCVTIIEKYK